MVLSYRLILDYLVKMVNLLKVIFKLSSFTGGDVFLHLDSFEITELGVDCLDVDFVLILDKLYDLLLFCLVLVMRIHKLNIVSLIDEKELFTEVYFLLIICYVQLDFLDLNLLIE